MAQLPGGSASDFWWLKPQPADDPLPAIRMGMQNAHQQRLDKITLAEQAYKAQVREQISLGAAELSRVIAENFKSGDISSPESQSRIWEVGIRYPTLLSTGVWKEYGDMMQNQEQIKQRKLQTESLNTYREQMLKNAQDRLNEPTTKFQESVEYKQLLSSANAAYASGDTAKGDEFKAQAEFMLPKGWGFETFTDENGERQLRAAQGMASGALGGAAASRAQSQMLGMENSIQLLGDLNKNLRGQDLGAAGVIGETVMDRWLPQLGLKTLDVKRADNRTKLKAAVQGMVRIISSDTGQFSNEDRRRAEAVMPSVGWGENVEHAQRTIKTLQDIFRKKAATNAKALGKPVPDWALTLDEVANKVGVTKELTREQAIQLIEKYGITE